MSIPITGWFLLPLGLVIVMLPWRICLIGLVTFAMMSPAAVVNIGSFGLQPGYYMLLLLVGRSAAQIMVGGYRLNAYVLFRMRGLFAFIAVAFLVLFVALCFFQGKVQTLPGTAGFNSNLTRPFHLVRENITQIVYVLMNACLVYCMAHQGARRAVPDLFRQWDTAMVCGLCFAAAVSLWQFASLYSGIYFPSDFFYSNAGYNRADSQQMVGLFRINGPFEEPSTLGYIFSSYLLFAWLRYRLYPTAFSVILITVCIFCLLVSTSTTAYFGLFLFACIAIYDVLAGRLHLLARNLRLSSAQFTAIFVIIAGIIGGSIVVAGNWDSIYYIIQDTVLHKTQSSSYQQRSFADMMALRIFVETYAVGIGLGSHKANNMLLTLLSNTGIAGLLCFVWFVLSLLRRVPFTIDRQQTERLRRAMRPYQWGLLGLLLIHIFSNPNLSTIALWVEMGGLLALQAALHKLRLRQPDITIPRNMFSRSRTAEPLLHRIRNARRPLAT